MQNKFITILLNCKSTPFYFRLKVALDKKSHDLRSIKIELDQKAGKSTSPPHTKREVEDVPGPVVVKNDDHHLSSKEKNDKSSSSSVCVVQ